MSVYGPGSSAAKNSVGNEKQRNNQSNKTGNRRQQGPSAQSESSAASSSSSMRIQSGYKHNPTKHAAPGKRPGEDARGAADSSSGKRSDTRASRSSSQSRSVTANRKRSRSMSPGEAGKRKATGSPRSPSSSTSLMPPPVPQQDSSARMIDHARIPPEELKRVYNTPSVGRDVGTLSTYKLYAIFPELYVPADFVRVEMDWLSMMQVLSNDSIRNMHASVPLLFESSPSTAESDEMVPVEAPKASYCFPQEGHDPLGYFPRASFGTPKPLKFNARVIITFGMSNAEERLDYNSIRKLRVLCARRKGKIMLLGGSWSAQLDGGDPMADRSVLYQTARRTVLAQSMFDIASCGNVTKLCEFHYNRPKEEIKGKEYPEQEEVTVVYMCAAQPPDGTDDVTFSNLWDHYCARANGSAYGPSLHMFAQNAAGLLSEAPMQYANDAEVRVGADISETETKVKDEDDVMAQSVKVEDDDDVKYSPMVEVEDKKDVEIASESTAAEAVAEAVAEVVAEATAVKEEEPSRDTQVESGTEMQTQDSKTGESVPDSSAKTSAEDDVKAVVEKPVAMKPKRKKPDAPCVLLCPPPVIAELGNDPSKKQDAVSLRLLPLSAILSYSQDDVNERIFEASLVGEIVKSLLAITYADVITDFIMAEHGAPSCCADPRVNEAVHVLRNMARKTLEQMQHTNGKNGSADEIEEGEEVDDERAVETAAATSEVASDKKNSAADCEHVCGGADEEVPIAIAVAEDALKDAEKEDEHMAAAEPAPASEGKGDQRNDKDKSHDGHDGNGKVDSNFSDPTKAEPYEEEEAREWRRAFVTACRWFDVGQRRCLTNEHLELIMHSSTRDISRADLSAAASAACKGSHVSPHVKNLRYELYI